MARQMTVSWVMMKQIEESGVSVSIATDHLDGFLRLKSS